MRKSIAVKALVGAASIVAVVTQCAAEERVYSVERGDTLSGIARKHHVTTDLLARWNALRDVDVLRAGSRLFIPDDHARLVKYVVRKGESLGDIGYLHGQTAARVAELNALPRPDHIYPGQTLLVPQEGSQSFVTPEVRKAADEPAIRSGRWRNIVIHHSGSTKDSPKIMDNFHRRVRKMENGLAYHFVIGGSGPRMEDGEIYVGDRWRRQLQGGHVASEALNAESIGICLVGNFDVAPPTPMQMRALVDLLDHLMIRCNLSAEDLYTHRVINPKPTGCPGARFPFRDLKKLLQR